MDDSRTELSTSASDMKNGYQCGQKFLSDELIRVSLSLVWNVIGKYNQYPVPYVGRLYPENRGYMIWPIFSRDGMYDYRSVEAGPYFLVIDKQGNLIGTIVQGLANNFLRCTRSRTSSIRPTSNVPNHSPAHTPDMPSGYYCDRVFFSNEAVEEAARAAKIESKQNTNNRFPLKYNGPPFRNPVILWPLMKNGHIFNRGPPGLFRVALNKNFDVEDVAIVQNSIIKLCRKAIKKKEKDHEKSDYFCSDHLLSNQNLQTAAETGCAILNKRQDTFFPATYKGPEFVKSGPYFTYPVEEDANFVGEPGTDRVVMNSNCEVVGALTTLPFRLDGHLRKRFVLCIKIQEASPTKTYIEPAVPIIEYSGKYKKLNDFLI